MENECELTGLDGSNPLGFLAALGAFRTLSLAMPEAEMRLSWRRRTGWRPVVQSSGRLDPADLVGALHSQLKRMENHPAFSFADNLAVPAEVFACYARQSQAAAFSGDRCGADFAAAFACEATTELDSKKQPVVQDTELRTMSGAGHQHFLGSIRHIIARTEPGHLEKALFQPWRYDDAVEKQTMRWDPMDDVRYALRWRNPSGDPARKKQGTMLGANCLAIEALPLLPSMPVGGKLQTTGFRAEGRRNTFWTWPIWDAPLSLGPVRSLLALKQLQDEQPSRQRLAAMGIGEIFRSQRLTVGKFRNFAPANPV